MYKSPIEILTTDIKTQIENDVMYAVIKQGVFVDRDELIKALKYDREQYDKGYNDAVRDLGLVRCENCKLLKSYEN